MSDSVSLNYLEVELFYFVSNKFPIVLGTGFERHHRICNRIHLSRTSGCEHVLQSVWIHQHDSGSNIHPRLQTRPLYEDPS